MSSNESSAVSGGLLVVLGIIVAVAAAILFMNYSGKSIGDGGGDVNITADLPDAGDN